MQQSTKIIRPATAALIVALAGSAAPVWAQDTQAAPPPVITTAPAPAPAPVQDVVSPPPIARTVTAAAPAPASVDAASRTTVNAEALAAAEADRPAPRRAEPARASAAPRTAAEAAAPRAATAPVERVAAPAAAPVETAAAPAATPARNDPAAFAAATAPEQPAAAENDPNATGIPLGWLLGGLGALALLGVAAAIVMRRRGERDYQEVHAHPELAAEPAVTVREEPVFAPRAAVAEPVLAAGPVRTAGGELIGRHEALAMEGPTADNPFLTRTNRLKRARFYDRQERLAGLAQRPASPFDRQPAAEPVREAGVVRSTVRPSRERAFGWPGAAKPAMG